MAILINLVNFKWNEKSNIDKDNIASNLKQKILDHLANFSENIDVNVRNIDISFKEKAAKEKIFQNIADYIINDESIDKCIVLFHEATFKKLNFVEDRELRAFFIKSVNGEDFNDSKKLLSIAIQCIKSLEIIKKIIDNNNLIKQFRLPIMNFKSIILKELCLSLSNAIGYEINGEVVVPLSRIKVSPRKKSKCKYIVDERNLYFSLGREKHGLAETKKEDGHDIMCYLNSIFRFGLRINTPEYHFNVCGDEKKNTIQEDLVNCHNDSIHKKDTHFNIFSNDFIR